MIRRFLTVTVTLSSLALAQGSEGPAAEKKAAAEVTVDSPEAKAANELVQKYLTAVKAKKWADARKFLHPKTLESIAERKKRLGREDHPMAPWYHEKIDTWLKDFKLVGVTAGAEGTFIVEASEDNYQVEEKGLAEGEKGTYLVGKKAGKWYVVDKKRGETFTRSSIRLGYKGWFDEPAAEPAAEE